MLITTLLDTGAQGPAGSFEVKTSITLPFPASVTSGTNLVTVAKSAGTMVLFELSLNSPVEAAPPGWSAVHVPPIAGVMDGLMLVKTRAVPEQIVDVEPAFTTGGASMITCTGVLLPAPMGEMLWQPY